MFYDNYHDKLFSILVLIGIDVNIKTKQILALEVTDEKVHDSKVLKNLVEGVLNNPHNIKIKSFLGDGGLL